MFKQISKSNKKVVKNSTVNQNIRMHIGLKPMKTSFNIENVIPGIMKILKILTLGI